MPHNVYNALPLKSLSEFEGPTIYILGHPLPSQPAREEVARFFVLGGLPVSLMNSSAIRITSRLSGNRRERDENTRW